MATAAAWIVRKAPTPRGDRADVAALPRGNAVVLAERLAVKRREEAATRLALGTRRAALNIPAVVVVLNHWAHVSAG